MLRMYYPGLGRRSQGLSRCVASDEAVTAVTLLHAPQARPDAEFLYLGPMPECEPCRVRAACLNQEKGRRYRVTAVRTVRHPCPLTGDEVVAVVADLAPPPMSWWAKAAMVGGTVTYEPLDCARRDCANYATCHPAGIAPGERVKLLETGGRLACPLGYEIVPCRVDYAMR
jgi:hypothetical protein